MPSREQVAQLIAAGFSVVPLVAGRKNPDDPNWQKKTYTADDFTPACNVGVKLGNGVCDVDLDTPEAVSAAGQLLYETRIHGRSGKRASHYWYRSSLGSQAFKDLDGTMLLETRGADNQQTAVPPSIHPSGQALEWEHDRPMLEVSADDLLRAVRAVAVAALFARHWPEGGSRHEAAAHVAGFLLRLGFDGTWTARIVASSARAAGDEEIEDRARAARDTAKKHAAGGKTTGAPRLASVFARGEELAARVYSWFGQEGADLLDKLNTRHFVAEMGVETVVGAETPSAPTLFLNFDQFRRRYYAARVGKQRLGEWWLSHPQQRRFRQIHFAPPPRGIHPEDYNTWRGFAIEPDPQPQPERRCVRFLAHLFQVICNGHQRHYEFLLDVMALTVQRPGMPAGVAVVMRGDPGAGKGTVVECFGNLFGAHYIQIDKQVHLTGQFNEHLSGKVVLFADEAVWGGSKQDIGALRRLVTEKTLTVERKYINAVKEPNCIHLWLATNEEWVWPASLRERRGFILDVEKKPFQDQAYFDDLYREWEQEGGAPAFLAFCQQRVVPGNRLGPLPMTEALQDQQKLSFDPLYQWWLEKLMQGDMGDGNGWPPFVSTAFLHRDYIDTTDQIGSRTRRLTESVLTERLKALLPRGATRARRPCLVNTARYGPANLTTMLKWGWVLPSLDLCRRQFDSVTGASYQWPPVDETPQILPEVDDGTL